MSEPGVLKRRKEKILQILKYYKEDFGFLGLLVLIFIGFKIRISNLVHLKDVATGKFIPGDPDAAAFLRYAKYILENGKLMDIDLMRYYPLGYSNLEEFNFLSHFIVYLYKFLHFFNSNVTLEYVDVIFPAVIFSLTLIPFYFLVKKLFNYKVALLSAAFLTVMPGFLYRTMSGVGDKESLAIFFFFTSLYFFVEAIKSEKKSGYLHGLLSGLSTAILGSIWGGVNFIFLILGLYILIKVILNSLDKREFYAYVLWWLSTFILLNIFYNKVYGFKSIILAFTSQITLVALASGLIYLLIVEFNVFNLQNKISLEKYPMGILSILSTGMAAFLSIPLGLTIYYSGGIKFYFYFIFNKGMSFIAYLTKPFSRDVWASTVAENVQPFIKGWILEFGWIYFLLILIASVLIFYELFRGLKKHKLALTSFFAFFIFGFIFNRYSDDSILNGLSGFSKFLYTGSIITFAIVISGYFLYSFYKNKLPYKEIETKNFEESKNSQSFEETERKKIELYNLKLSQDKALYDKFININKTYLFLLIWFVITAFGARSTIRLVFLFVPVTTVLVSYFLVKIFDYGLSTNDKLYKFCALVFVGLIIFVPFVEGGLIERAEITIYKSKTMLPRFDHQWQIAMNWVRENTSKDSVFAHWWDYGYWLQTFGERATLSDGGNARGAINYFIGRHLLTGRNRTEALELLKTHNATHLLIVYEEIGKYAAFSSIGSDENLDKSSSIKAFFINPKETVVEKTEDSKERVYYFYIGNFVLDEDLVFNGKIFPKEKSTIMGITLISEQKDKAILSLKSSSIIVSHNGIANEIPLNCIFLEDKEYVFDIDDAYQGCARIFPVVRIEGDGIKVSFLDGALLLSPKVRNTLFTQLYLFDKDEENDLNWKGFKKVYDDSKEGRTLAYYSDVRRLIGPLKIWEMNYPENIKEKPEYLEG